MDNFVGGVYGEIRLDQGNLDREIEQTRQALKDVADEMELLDTQMQGAYSWSEPYREMYREVTTLIGAKTDLVAKTRELEQAERSRAAAAREAADLAKSAADASGLHMTGIEDTLGADYEAQLDAILSLNAQREEAITLNQQEAAATRALSAEQSEAAAQTLALALNTGQIITASSMAAHAAEQEAIAQHASTQADVSAAIAAEGLEQAQERLVRTGTLYSTELGEEAVALGRLRNELVSTKISTEQLAASMGYLRQASGGASSQFKQNLGFSILFVSQAIEDLQFGVRAVLNNIPMIVMAMGGSAGLAGTISIVAVAANVLAEHWGSLQEMLQQGIPVPALTGLEGLEDRLKKVNKEIQELRKEGRLTAPDAGRLDQLEDEKKTLEQQRDIAKEVDRLEKMPAKGTEANARGFIDAIRGKGALGQLEAALGKDVGPNGKVQDFGSGTLMSPREAAGRMLAEAAGGDAAVRDHIQKVLRDAFGAENPLAMAIEENKPAVVAAAKDQAEILNEAGKENERIGKEAEREAAARDKAAAKERQKALEERGKALAQGALGTRELANPRSVTAGDVEKALIAAGVPPGEAKAQAGAVLGQMRGDLFSQASLLAMRNGGTVAGAFTDLAAQRADKAADEHERLANEATRNAQRRLPGAQRGAEDTMVRGLLSGMTEAQAQAFAREQLKVALKATGLSDAESELGAVGITAKAGKRLGEELTRGELNPEQRRSETIDIRGFQNKVQAGVGGEQDTAKQRLKALENILNGVNRTADAIENMNPALG